MQIGKPRTGTSGRQGRRWVPDRVTARGLLVLGACLVAFSAAIPRTALAYTDAEIATFLKRHFSCSVLAPDGTQSGQVRGAGGPIQVFVYGAEGCPGLPFEGASFAAVAPGTGGMGLLVPTPAPTAVESVAIADGYIVETSVDYAPSDSRCCPSRHVRRRCAVSGYRLVRAP